MLTDEQKQNRRKFICATDIATICGLSKYGNPGSVWLNKVYGIDDGGGGNEATLVGDICEPGLLQHVRRYLKDPNAPVLLQDFKIHSNRFCASTLDLHCPTSLELAEAKTCGILHEAKELEEWGEAGSDNVPGRIYIQAQWQMYVCGPNYKINYIPTILRDRGFQLFITYRDQELIARMELKATKFWNEHILTRIPPADFVMTPELAGLLATKPGKKVEVDPALVYALELGDDELSEEEIQTKLALALDDARYGTVNGVARVEAVTSTRKGYVVKDKRTTYYRPVTPVHVSGAAAGILEKE